MSKGGTGLVHGPACLGGIGPYGGWYTEVLRAFSQETAPLHSHFSNME